MITQNFGNLQPPMMWGLLDFYLAIQEDMIPFVPTPPIPKITFVNLPDEIKFKDEEQ